MDIELESTSMIDRSRDGLASASWEFMTSGDDASRSLERYFVERPALELTDRLDCVLMDQWLRWQNQPGPTVDDYIQRFAEFGDHPTLLLDIVYGEVRHRRRLHLPVNLESICARYPAVAEDLIQQLSISEGDVTGDVDGHSAWLGSHSIFEGQTFASFRLGRRLGGSLADVFQACCLVSQREVVLKIFHDDPSEFADAVRFQNELATVAELKHSAVLEVLDHGEEDGLKWICFPFLWAGDLATNSDGIRSDFNRITEIMIDLTGAVDAIHRQGFAHRDLKPSNVLLDDSGRVKLIDFEFARRLHPVTTPRTVSEAAGSLAWIAPEVIRNPVAASDIGHDIHGLGGILCYLLTGEPPNIGETALEVMRHLHSGTTRALDHVVGVVPEELLAVCRKAIDPDPGSRYSSAAAMLRDLQAVRTNEPRIGRTACLSWL